MPLATTCREGLSGSFAGVNPGVTFSIANESGSASEPRVTGTTIPTATSTKAAATNPVSKDRRRLGASSVTVAMLTVAMLTVAMLTVEMLAVTSPEDRASLSALRVASRRSHTALGIVSGPRRIAVTHASDPCSPTST